MPEIKETPVSQSQLTKQFIEFIMMQGQQTSLFLGKIPSPATGQTVQNLEAARLFIDQLEMLREKTRGNLSSEESEILNHVLSDLRFSYVEAVSAPQENKQPLAEPMVGKNTGNEKKDYEEGKKKFSKNYGT